MFLFVGPGVVAGLVPWLLTGWETGEAFHSLPLQAVGVATIGAGVAVLVTSFARFVHEGLGTPAPVAPTEPRRRRSLPVRAEPDVSGGRVDHRRPGAPARRPVLLVYALVFLAAVVSFVRWYEEPTLVRRFGEQYEAYRRAVPGWWPRRSPWKPGADHTSGRDR